MLGHPLEQVRDKAIVLLTIVYDGVDWQKRAPFNCRVSKVNSKF